jgi:hypothetical protein
MLIGNACTGHTLWLLSSACSNNVTEKNPRKKNSQINIQGAQGRFFFDLQWLLPARFSGFE